MHLLISLKNNFYFNEVHLLTSLTIELLEILCIKTIFILFIMPQYKNEIKKKTCQMIFIVNICILCFQKWLNSFHMLHLSFPKDLVFLSGSYLVQHVSPYNKNFFSFNSITVWFSGHTAPSSCMWSRSVTHSAFLSYAHQKLLHQDSTS